MSGLQRAVLGLVLAGLTILLGLGSRRYPEHLPSFVAEYAGDALWAMMVFFLSVAFFPRAKLIPLGIGVLGFCFLIELSQLYHAPWIDQIRATRLGGLVLGFGFLWSDLVCYAVGVFFAGVCVSHVTRRGASSNA